MADIEIKREHSLGADAAKERVVSIEPKLKEKYRVELRWNGQQAEVKGRGVSGTLKVGEGDVGVEIKLGLLLKPVASKIRDALDRELTRSLG